MMKKSVIFVIKKQIILNFVLDHAVPVIITINILKDFYLLKAVWSVKKIVKVINLNIVQENVDKFIIEK